MWLSKGSGGDRRDDPHQAHGSVAVAIDKDKASQHALKWAIDHLLTKGQSVYLIHVNHKAATVPSPNVHDNVAIMYKQQLDSHTKDLFLPFRCFCSRKDIKCQDITLEASDIPKAITEFLSHSAIENMVIGASSKNAFFRRCSVTLFTNQDMKVIQARRLSQTGEQA